MTEPFDITAKLSQRLAQHTAERSQIAHLISTSQTQLSNLSKSTPKRPRDSRTTLNNQIQQLEKERVRTSLSLSVEKSLLREIASRQKSLRLHDIADAHAESLRRKRLEVERATERLRSIDSVLAEIQKVLDKVRLADRLGCTAAELIVREVECPPDKIGGVCRRVGGEEAMMASAEKRGANIAIDRVRGRFVVRGGREAVDVVVVEMEEMVGAVDEEVRLTRDRTAYFSSGGVLEEIQRKNEGVEFDFLARMNRIVLHGPRDKVDKARRELEVEVIATKERGLVDGKEVSTVVGKTGGTIRELSRRHGVVVDVTRAGEAATLRVIGPPSNVDAALAEVNSLLFDNEQIEESLLIDPLMKGELIANSGASIREFQNAVSNAVNAAGGVLLFLDRNAAKDSPTLTIKCSRSGMVKAKSLVAKKIQEFESNIDIVTVPKEIVPAIIGKGGSKINALRQTGNGAAVEADASGLVKIYSRDADTRSAVKSAIEQIVAENHIGYVPIQSKGTLGFLFGDRGKEVMARVNEMGCNLSVSEDDTRLVIKGTEEDIAKASELLNEFLSKNYLLEIDVHPDDETLLFAGGANNLLHTVEEKYEVKANFRKEKSVLIVRGESEKAHAAKKEIETFLFGGEGVSVCKFKVPEDAVGSVVGKGGSNLAKLEADFEGVRIHIPKDKNLVSIRGPEELVKKCRIRIVTDVATMRIGGTLQITPVQHSDLANTDVIKKIAGGTNTSFALNEDSVKIRGVSHDVRDAKSLLNEHFTGVYAGYIDLDASQCTRLKSTITKDPSHFERIKLSTGADVMVDESESVIKVTGKKSNVKKAKLSLLGVLEFMFPKQFQTVKVHKTLFKSMGEAEKLAEIAATTGASLYLDRDLISVVIRSESPDESSKALDLISARLVESEKLNYVFRLPASDAWLLPIIIGKGGSSVKKIEAETGCTVDIFKDELTVVVRAESEEAVAIGKDVLEAMVEQARKECVFIDMPESAMPAFIGKGGANIKQLSSEYDVEIEKSKKNASKIQISGKEEAVAKANDAVLSWLNEWEASHVGLSIDVETHFMYAILGKGGETIKELQKSTGCKIDLDRNHSKLTVREGTESDRVEAMARVKAIIDEEKAAAAERAAEKEKLRQEQGAVASAAAKDPLALVTSIEEEDDSSDAGIEGAKDRSKEFSARPVGMAAAKPKANISTYDVVESGTKEGRELYLMLISGNDPSEEPDDQWDSSTVSSSAAMISACDSNEESDLHYRSISGFLVRI